MQTYQVHYLVHQKGRTRHISGVFQQREEKEHYYDVGEKGKHGTHALQHTVNHHTGEPSRSKDSAEPVAEGIDSRFYPSLRICAECKGTLEHGKKYEYHQRES